ncbi:hypothetical protein CUMW_168930, partial [Citrus unshiu]
IDRSPKRNPNSSLAAAAVANSWSVATIRRHRPTLNRAVGSPTASHIALTTNCSHGDLTETEAAAMI